MILQTEKCVFNFTILERITLKDFLPNIGNYKDLIIARDFNDKMSFKKDEFDKYFEKPDSNGNMIIKRTILKEEYEMILTADEYKAVKEKLKALDLNNELTINLISLYEKIV